MHVKNLHCICDHPRTKQFTQACSWHQRSSSRTHFSSLGLSRDCLLLGCDGVARHGAVGALDGASRL